MQVCCDLFGICAAQLVQELLLTDLSEKEEQQEYTPVRKHTH